jgi:hypothetical protein
MSESRKVRPGFGRKGKTDPHGVVVMTDADKNKLILESLRKQPCAVCIEKVGIASPDSDERCSLCGMSFKQRVLLFSPKG